jgi:hypothetical protein
MSAKKITLQQAYALSTGTFISPTNRKRFTTNIVRGSYKTKLEALLKTTPIDLTEIPSLSGGLVDPVLAASGYDLALGSLSIIRPLFDLNFVTLAATTGQNKFFKINGNGQVVSFHGLVKLEEDKTKIASSETPYWSSWPDSSYQKSSTFRLLPPLENGRCRVLNTGSGDTYICFALSLTIPNPLPAPYDVTSIAVNSIAFWNLPTNCQVEVYGFVADSGNPGVNFNTTTPFFTKADYTEATTAVSWSNSYGYKYGEYADYSGTIYRAKSNSVPVGTLPTDTTHWIDTGESSGTPISKYTPPSIVGVTISTIPYYEIRIHKDNTIPFLLGSDGKYSITPNPSYQANWFNLSTTSPPVVVDDTDPNPPTWDAGFFKVSPVNNVLNNASSGFFITSNFLPTGDQLTSVGSSQGAVIGASFGTVLENSKCYSIGSSFIYGSDGINLDEYYYHKTGQIIVNKLKK